MHNAQAQLRAIETNRYLVRAANTGISSVITDRGEILSLLLPLTEGYIVGEVEFNSSRTVYSYIGNAFVYLCAFLLVTALVCEKIYAFSSKKGLTKTQKNVNI